MNWPVWSQQGLSSQEPLVVNCVLEEPSADISQISKLRRPLESRPSFEAYTIHLPSGDQRPWMFCRCFCKASSGVSPAADAMDLLASPVSALCVSWVSSVPSTLITQSCQTPLILSRREKRILLSSGETHGDSPSRNCVTRLPSQGIVQIWLSSALGGSET